VRHSKKTLKAQVSLKDKRKKKKACQLDGEANISNNIMPGLQKVKGLFKTFMFLPSDNLTFLELTR
jgi:hypothetical protein